jgi:Spy/CpxP family protein refolding chaperone
MKTKVIVALLLSIVTASQPAFTTVRRKIPSDEPPQVTMVGVSADIARMAAVPTEPTLSPGGETVSVAMPFSSLQLNQSLVEYLGLNPTQVRSIQRLMDQERPRTQPLMLELRTVSAELGVAIRQNQSDDNERVAQGLAATQARLLKQLMRANSRLQRRIDDVLEPQQRKKLDVFRRKAEVSLVHGN